MNALGINGLGRCCMHPATAKEQARKTIRAPHRRT
jgi:hypothetical protein